MHQLRKTIVITGASSGLGADLARHAAKTGANLVLLARREEALLKLQQELTEAASVRVLPLDVTDRNAVEQVFQQIGHVDVLINNAGMGVFEWAHQTAAKDTEQMIDVNVKGLIYCTEQVVSQMMARKSGHIINIASQAGKIATPKSAVYAATKHAVLGYTNSLRMEVSLHGVLVTAVNPGPIQTPFFDQADPSGTYVKNAGRVMLDSNEVAKKVIASIGCPVRELNMPRWMAAGAKLHSLFPGLVERIGRNAFFKK